MKQIHAEASRSGFRLTKPAVLLRFNDGFKGEHYHVQHRQTVSVQFRFKRVSCGRAIVGEVQLDLRVRVNFRVIKGNYYPLNRVVASHDARVDNRIRVRQRGKDHNARLNSRVASHHFPHHERKYNAKARVFSSNVHPALRDRSSYRFRSRILQEYPSTRTADRFCACRFQRFRLPFRAYRRVRYIDTTCASNGRPRAAHV